MEPCYSGALRLAAARGDVKAMQALADGAPRFHPDADHEGFTALHAAAVEGKAREWQLMLCNTFQTFGWEVTGGKGQHPYFHALLDCGCAKQAQML
jgi:hypothetical protein